MAIGPRNNPPRGFQRLPYLREEDPAVDMPWRVLVKSFCHQHRLVRNYRHRGSYRARGRD